ncbi:hypothetical protein BYT27DRAFT_7184994 [Phlegmacium glaucopus]|nr:hypothetical protein BYT27DRAFT_7184994 [Phlegmacium glaucopus]
MSFFKGASNVKIIGGEFNDIKGNLTVFDRSRHETNVNNSNVYNNKLINSFNDNSIRIRPRNRYPIDDDDDPMQSTASTSKDDREEEDHTGTPPPQHPPFMPRNISSAGGNVTNKDSFNVRNTNVKDVFNDYSRNYYDGLALPTKQRRRQNPSIYEEEEEDIQSNSRSPRGGVRFNASPQVHFQGGFPQHMRNGMSSGPFMSVDSPLIQHMDPNSRRNFEKLMKYTMSQTEPNAPRYSDENYESDDADSSPHSFGTKDYTMANLSINDPASSPMARDQHHPDLAMHLSRPPPISRVKSDPQIAMHRNFSKSTKPTLSVTQSNMHGNSDEDYESDDTDSSPHSVGTKDYTMANLSINDPDIAMHLSRPPPFSRTKSDPQIAPQPNTPEVDYPMSSSHTSNLSSPYNNRLYSCSNPSLAPHMKKPTMVNYLANLLAAVLALQDDIYGKKHPNKPASTSVFNFSLPSIGGLIKGVSNHGDNTEKKTLQDTFNDWRSLDKPVGAVDRSSSNHPQKFQPGPQKELVKIHVLIAAEGALKHVADSKRTAEINAAFQDLKILKSEYLVLAGFNEYLIQIGGGYLEEIHIFCCVEIPNPQPLLSRLGKVLTPYPGIFFTPSSVYKTPVFKDDGAIWDYDYLSLDRSKRLSDILSKGISHSDLVPVTSFVESQPSSTSVTLSRSEGGGNNNHGGAGEDKGNNHSDDHDHDHEKNDSSDDSKPDSDPEDPGSGGDGDSSTPIITFDVRAELFNGTSDSVPFQELEINGTLAVKTNPAQLKPRQLSKSHVEFRKLGFQSTRESAGPMYKQSHVGVEINTNDKNTDIGVLQPLKTPAYDHKMTETTTKNVTTNKTFGGSVTLAAMPTLSLSGNKSEQKNAGTAQELRKYHSMITERHSRGIVSWGFEVGDPIEKRAGIAFGGYRALPSVDFRFYGTSDVGPPPPPPEHFDVTITSSWSLLTPASNNRNRRTRASGLLSSIKKSKVPLVYSNLCQVVKLQLPSDQLQETFYRSVTSTKVNEAASTETVDERPALYKVTHTVELSQASLEPESHSPVQSSSHQH